MFGKSHPISCLSTSSIHWQFPNLHCILVYLDPCIQHSHLLVTRHLKFNTSRTDLIFTQNLLALEALQWRAIPSFQLSRLKNLVTSLSHMPHPVYPSASTLDTVIKIYTESDNFLYLQRYRYSLNHHQLLPALTILTGLLVSTPHFQLLPSLHSQCLQEKWCY